MRLRLGGVSALGFHAAQLDLGPYYGVAHIFMHGNASTKVAPGQAAVRVPDCGMDCAVCASLIHVLLLVVMLGLLVTVAQLL